MHSQNECGKYEFYHYKLRLAEVLSSTGIRDCRYNDEVADNTDHVDDESLLKPVRIGNVGT
jgi:tRNA G26 N,N-dimethylase Trm1